MIGQVFVAAIGPAPPVEHNDSWVYDVWHTSTRGWAIAFFDIILLIAGLYLFIVHPFDFLDKQIAGAYLGATSFIFYYLYGNLDRTAHELMQVNMRIPVGVGAGITVVSILRFVTGVPDFPIEWISIVAGFFADSFYVYLIDFFSTLEYVLSGNRP